MLSLSAKTREITGKKVKTLRQKGLLPAVLYGTTIKTLALQINVKEFEKVYQEAGESAMINLKVEGGKEVPVLIKEAVRHPVTDHFIHVDFYQPKLEETIEATVPLVFEGEAPAVKGLGGTLVKNISEIEVKALPMNLPSEIKVDISHLATFDDNITIGDLTVAEGVEILKGPKEVVATITPPREEEKEAAPEEVVEEEEKEEGEPEKPAEEREKEKEQ